MHPENLLQFAKDRTVILFVKTTLNVQLLPTLCNSKNLTPISQNSKSESSDILLAIEVILT